MKLIEKDENKIVLRGWGEDSLGQKFENYGLIVIFTNQKILNCILRLYDRNVYIKYLNHDDLNNPIEIDSISDLTQQIKNGVIIENKIDGEKAEWTYLDNVKHGEWKTFFSNGQLKENGYLNQGTPEGAWKAFNNNGTLRAIGQYEKGYQVGHWKFNDERGCLRAEGSYINGKQKGKWTYYDENGEIEGSEVL
jgi:antitoxin component YwqK of YwqJK toxin-antitoxin module